MVDNIFDFVDNFGLDFFVVLDFGVSCKKVLDGRSDLFPVITGQTHEVVEVVALEHFLVLGHEFAVEESQVFGFPEVDHPAA